MIKEDNERISIREYAKRIGVDEKAIRNAIVAGKIKKGYDVTVKKIIPSAADKEYGNVVVKKPSKIIEKSVQKNPKKKSGEKSQQKETEKEDPLIAKDNDSYAEALRKSTIIKANTDALKLREREGQLVEKQKVFKSLFAFGKEMRLKFQSIPDRVIDEVLASPGRNEAHILLSNAISDVLDELTNTKEINIKL